MLDTLGLSKKKLKRTHEESNTIPKKCMRDGRSSFFKSSSHTTSFTRESFLTEKIAAFEALKNKNVDQALAHLKKCLKLTNPKTLKRYDDSPTINSSILEYALKRLNPGLLDSLFAVMSKKASFLLLQERSHYYLDIYFIRKLMAFSATKYEQQSRNIIAILTSIFKVNSSFYEAIKLQIDIYERISKQEALIGDDGIELPIQEYNQESTSLFKRDIDSAASVIPKEEKITKVPIITAPRVKFSSTPSEF